MSKASRSRLFEAVLVAEAPLFGSCVNDSLRACLRRNPPDEKTLWKTMFLPNTTASARPLRSPMNSAN